MFKDNLGYIASLKNQNQNKDEEINTGQEKTQVTTTEDSNKTFPCKLIRSLAQTLDYVPGN